ncbi:MAG: PKD domain-containing protein [Bacteroidetes bacterium]|nr:PKD domain-containing protein [Bacteroidota bacterium]
MIRKIVISTFTIALCLAAYYSMTYPYGPPSENTNAPSESNCTSCHSGSIITSGSNWNNITLSSNFTGNGYIPDSTYTIKISHSQSGISKWGFQATVLDLKNKMAGSFTASGRVQKGSSSSLSREYVLQTSTGTSSTGTNSTDWTFSWKAPSKNVGNVKFYFCVLAANGDNSSSGDNAYSKSLTLSPSSLLPVANAFCKDSVTCAGTSITLNGSSTNSATSWAWVLTGGTPSSSTSQNPVVKYNNVGTYWAILTAKNSKGVSIADSLKIVVKSKPSLSISGATSYKICSRDSVKLTATYSPNYQYTWSPGGFVSQTIWAKDSGNYYVSIKDNNNCTNTAGPVKITKFTAQTISISRDVNNDTICYEYPVKVTASGTTTFDTILYYTSSGLFQKTIVNPQTFNLSTSTDLYAKGKDANGCVTPPSNKYNFVVKNKLKDPVLNCTDKTVASFLISWDSIPKAKGYQVSIDTGRSWINPSSGKYGLSHSVLGFPSNTDVQVWVKALDNFPCYQSNITKVLCGSIPCSPVTYNVEYDSEVCKGDDINFKIKNLNTKHYSLKINNSSQFKDTVFKITSDFSQTYKIVLTDSNNLSCPTVNRNATVKVWDKPLFDFSSSNLQNIFCEGFPAIFKAEPNNYTEYEFFLNSTSVQKGTNTNWEHSNPKNLDSVWVIVKNGVCTEISNKIKIGIKPLPTAKFTYIANGKKLTFDPEEKSEGTKYLWDFGDGQTDTVKSPVHDFTSSGLIKSIVKLSVTDVFGCTMSDTLTVSIPAKINKISIRNYIKIYPQPSAGIVNIDIPNELFNSKITFTDITGKEIFNTYADKNHIVFSYPQLSEGIYFITIQNNDFIATNKLFNVLK